jgi:PAS domain S-box-containing protein
MEMRSMMDSIIDAPVRGTMQGTNLPAAGVETLLMLLRLADCGVWSVDRGSGVLRWDDHMHSLFGLVPATFSERLEDFFDLVHSEDRDRIRRQFCDALYQSAQFSTEYRVVWPSDGSVHFLRSKGGLCQGETDGACRMAGICWDVTESKEKERSNSWELHLMGALMENIPDKVYFKDISGRFIRINRAMREWFGEEEDAALIGKTDFGFFSEEHARQAFDDEQSVISTGVPIVHKEVMEKWRDGRTTWISATKLPLRDREGRIVGTFGISLDNTHQKQIEEELREQLEQLRVRNAELEKELKRRS